MFENGRADDSIWDYATRMWSPGDLPSHLDIQSGITHSVSQNMAEYNRLRVICDVRETWNWFWSQLFEDLNIILTGVRWM